GPSGDGLEPPDYELSDDSAQDPLDRQLAALARAVLPRSADRDSKEAVLKRIEQVACQVTGSPVRVLPFGSSANGCGERWSDIDAVVAWTPRGKVSKGFAGEILASIAMRCVKQGFILRELRLKAKVPIAMLETADGYEIDLSCGNLVPLLNTRLLRTYACIEPRLPVLACAVKRWAK
ncbi:unnamed protein product, partial [Polarella glacialis]